MGRIIKLDHDQALDHYPDRLLGVLSAPCAPQSLAGGHQGDRRAELRRQMEALASDLLPQIAKMNGFDRYQPVRIDVKDKAELREMLIEELRTVPGSDLFRRASRTLAELGYWPRGTIWRPE